MQSKKSFISQILLMFRPFWKPIFFVFCFLAIIQLVGTVSPYLLGKSVDSITTGNIKLTFYFVSIAFLTAIFQYIFLGWFKDMIELKKLDSNVEKYFSVFSLEKMLKFSVGQHTNEHSGVKQGIMNKGQTALQSFMYTMFYTILPNFLQIFVTLIILAIFDWRIAVSAFIFMFCFLFLSFKTNTKFFPRIDEMRKNRQSETKIQSELYRNTTLVISEAQESAAVSSFEDAWSKVGDFEKMTWTSYLKVFYPQKLLIIVGLYGSFTLGIYFIVIGQHSVGAVITLFTWLGSIFGNLTFLTYIQRQVLFQIVEIKKYFDLLDIAPDIDPNPNGIIIDDLQGKIEFKNVSFAYPYRRSVKEEEEEIEIDEDQKEDHTVSGINLVIPAGAKVGFVGMSGSGKTTIVNLMRRYYEATEGEILIDGVPLKELNLKWLRSHIGNVEQKIDLFDRSIKDNILFGLPEENKNIDDEKLNKIIEDASLSEFIEKLKDHGLDTMIGEGGIKVSGGERQRIGIARALIKNPKILIFDEATSALDSHNEKLIHEAINRGAEGRTTIIIAHRLSTIADADKIFVVADGKIVGEGTHTELSKSCEEYKDLLKHQLFV